MPRAYAEDRTNMLGEFIRRRRAQLAISQATVANALKVTAPEFVGMIEAGHRKPNLERVPQLAEVLKVPIADVMRLALADIFPSLVNNLIWNDYRTSAKAREAIDQLTALPASQRDSIISVINRAYTSYMSKSHPARRTA